MNVDQLSEKQRAILKVIETWLKRSGYPPTIRDIGKAVGISSTSVVNYNLNKLVEAGFITRSKDVSRGIRLNSSAESEPIAISDDPDVVHVPLLGQIVAGNPVPTPDSSGYYSEEDLRAVPRILIGNADPSQIYALNVKGLSMIDSMINDGDMVILKKQMTARNGEMVAVWLSERNETTLKHFYDEGAKVRLQPANPQMDPIFVEKDKVQVQGKVLAVLRRLPQ